MAPPNGPPEIDSNDHINGHHSQSNNASLNRNVAGTPPRDANEAAIHDALNQAIENGDLGPFLGNSIMEEGNLWMTNAGKYIRHLEETQRKLVEHLQKITLNGKQVQFNYNELADAALQSGNTIDELRAANTEFARMKLVVEGQIAELEKTIKELKAERDSLKDRVAALMKGGGVREEDIENEVGLAKKNREDTVLELEKKIGTLDNQITNLTTENQRATAAYTQVYQELSDLKEQFQHAREGCKGHNQYFDQQRERFNTEIRRMTLEAVVTKGAVENLNTQVTDLRATVSEKDWVIHELKSENTSLDDDAGESQMLYDSSGDELDHQRALVESLTATLDESKAAVEVKTAHIQHLQARLNELEKAANRLEEENKVMADANIDKSAKHEQEIGILWKDKLAWQDTINHLRARVTHLEDEARTIFPPGETDMVTRLNTQINTLTEENTTLQNHVDNMVISLNTERNILAMQQNAHESQLAKLKEQNQALAAAQYSASINANTHRRSSTSSSSARDSSLNSLNSLIDSLATEKSALELKISHLLSDLATQKSQIENYLKEKAEKESEETRVAVEMVLLRLKVGSLGWEKEELEKLHYAGLKGITHVSRYVPFQGGFPVLNPGENAMGGSGSAGGAPGLGGLGGGLGGGLQGGATEGIPGLGAGENAMGGGGATFQGSSAAFQGGFARGGPSSGGSGGL